MKKLKLLILAILTIQMSFGFFGFRLGPVGVFGGRRWGGRRWGGPRWGGGYYGRGYARPYYGRGFGIGWGSPFFW